MIELNDYQVMIIGMICEHFGEEPKVIHDKSRVQKKVFARQIVMKYLRGLGYSLKTIGRYMDKDHSTIIHGLKSAEQLVLSVESINSFWKRINMNEVGTN